MRRGLHKKRGAMKCVRAIKGTIRLLLRKTPAQNFEPTINRAWVSLSDSAGDRVAAVALLFDKPFAGMILVPLDVDSSFRAGGCDVGSEVVRAPVGRCDHEPAGFKPDVVSERAKN